MPKFASSYRDVKLCYLNGHFGYFQKSIISTNGFGLIRDVNFYDSDNHLSLDLTPQELKDQYDATSLIPTLETFFFSFIPILNIHTLLVMLALTQMIIILISTKDPLFLSLVLIPATHQVCHNQASMPLVFLFAP